MSDYLISIIGAVAVGALVELLPPDEEHGTSHPLRLLVGLLICCTVVLPILDAAGQGGAGLLARFDAARAELDTLPAAADAYAARTLTYIREASADAAERELVTLLAERFGLSAEHCRAEVTLGHDGEKIVLVGVKVYLRGRGILADTAGLEAYLAALFGTQVIVAIE